MTTDDSRDDPTDDDLTAIKGIGPARQSWLREVFDIRSFADLAALSVDQIETALKDEKRAMVTRSDIHDWLVQAKDLATVSGDVSPRTPDAPDTGAEETADTKAEPDWTPFASFVVEYRHREAIDLAERHQTHVHHVEGDVSETWPGLQGEALGSWMLEHAEKLALPEPEPDVSDDAEDPAPLDLTLPSDADFRVQVTEVQIHQPTDAEPSPLGGTDQTASGFIRKMEPFALDADFELLGSDAKAFAERAIPYICQFYAHDLTSGTSLHLGDSIPSNLIDNQVGYRASLFFARLPEGAYRLHVLVVMQTSPPVPGHLELSVLQVL